MPTRDDFEKLYQTYSTKIFRFLAWQTNNARLAEDLTSEVFLRAWGAWARFHGPYQQAWLYRIARNVLTDFWRKKKDLPLEMMAEPSIQPDLDERLDQKARQETIRLAVAKLTEPLRTVIILRFFEDHTSQEVAKVLGINEGHVRVLQYRALQNLREALHDIR